MRRRHLSIVRANGFSDAEREAWASYLRSSAIYCQQAAKPVTLSPEGARQIASMLDGGDVSDPSESAKHAVADPNIYSEVVE